MCVGGGWKFQLVTKCDKLKFQIADGQSEGVTNCHQFRGVREKRLTGEQMFTKIGFRIKYFVISELWVTGK